MDMPDPLPERLDAAGVSPDAGAGQDAPAGGGPAQVLRSDERHIIERLLAGDEAAFEALVTCHHGAMLRFARTFISKPDVAEEVVQETWLAVLRGLPAFEGRASLKTWIFRILANRARTRATREARTVPFAELAPAGDEHGDTDLESRFGPDGRWSDPPVPWQVNTPEGIILRREVMEQLEIALGTLPPAQRAVVTLRDIEGWSTQEICSVLQISETNQRVLLHRARTHLRRALEDVLGRDG
jgi:RNA polymerase sigma-70 factor (ECF subfamily)